MKRMTPLCSALLIFTIACDEREMSSPVDFEEIVFQNNNGIAQNGEQSDEMALECVPHFRVQNFEDIVGNQFITIAGASCLPDDVVRLRVTLENGQGWEDEVLTMDNAKGYFTIDMAAPSPTDNPRVCVAFGQEDFICPLEEETIPWAWSGDE